MDCGIVSSIAEPVHSLNADVTLLDRSWFGDFNLGNGDTIAREAETIAQLGYDIIRQDHLDNIRIAADFSKSHLDDALRVGIAQDNLWPFATLGTALHCNQEALTGLQDSAPFSIHLADFVPCHDHTFLVLKQGTDFSFLKGFQHGLSTLGIHTNLVKGKGGSFRRLNLYLIEFLGVIKLEIENLGSIVHDDTGIGLI